MSLDDEQMNKLKDNLAKLETKLRVEKLINDAWFERIKDLEAENGSRSCPTCLHLWDGGIAMRNKYHMLVEHYKSSIAELEAKLKEEEFQRLYAKCRVDQLEWFIKQQCGCFGLESGRCKFCGILESK